MKSSVRNMEAGTSEPVVFSFSLEAAVLFSVDLYQVFCVTSGPFEYRRGVCIQGKKNNRRLRGMNMRNEYELEGLKQLTKMTPQLNALKYFC